MKDENIDNPIKNGLKNYHTYLINPNSHTAKKVFNDILMFLISVIYAFSAMPSTVNFYRAIVPPLVIKSIEESKSVDKSVILQNTANHVINTAQIFALPALLFVLELISIFMAIEIWRCYLYENAKGVTITVILFLFCQTYPFISIIYQISSTEVIFANTEKTQKSQIIKDKKADVNSDINYYRKKKDEADKELRKYENRSKTTDIINKIKELKNETAEIKNKLESATKTRNDSFDNLEGTLARQNSPITHLLDDPFSKTAMASYFLGALFPIILISLGYYRAKYLYEPSQSNVQGEMET